MSEFTKDFMGHRARRRLALSKTAKPAAGALATPGAILASGTLSYDPDDPGNKILVGAWAISSSGSMTTATS